MNQQDIYSKDIFRPINGVIKADSTQELKDEINEFVITAEQQQDYKLPKFFHTLIPGQKPLCTWISGDFGSGKSHLLKILSYVLENDFPIDGRPCADIFAEKAEDFELRGDIQKACRIPTESVLFNIQEKLDATTKSTIDPVLNIFVKEFNRKLGYDDKKPEIAEIERYFENKGKYVYFKQEYERRFGETWENGRKSILLKQQRLAELMADIDGIDQQTAANNIKTQIANYKIDTDGFVSLVKAHLDKQQPGSRFIFFVDEVGQFIGKDVHRMLSLQTIAEGLSDKTDGRSIIIVTSQMDIDATLGNLDKQQQYDFSRIQGRFETRINLTSANADEVIQRRLLEKKPEPQQMLCEVYQKESHIIKSLFCFGDNSQFKSQYKNDQQFAIDFPFIDYQFYLVQSCIIELSKNNAFSGKQQSVGERSLLTITQEVAKAYAGKDLNHIVQFSDMYEGLRGILQTKIQSDIQQAERTLGDDLALKVLKTLFLIKYVKGFPSTADNITKLLLPTLDTDFQTFRSDIHEALNKLVHLSYIEKAANEEYHFQTNEEKDIETEIKNESLTPDAINEELKKIFRDEIYYENKVKLSPNKIFSYGKMVDERQDGRDADIYIHFITPLYEGSTDEQSMKMYSSAHLNQLCVVLGEDKYMTEDLVMFKKADKCLNRLMANGSDDYRQQIVSDKRIVNRKRRENIVARLIELSKKARLYLGGYELDDIRSTDIKTRLTEAMTRLVNMEYKNLAMLTIEYDDTLLKRIISSTTEDRMGYEMDACCLEVMNKLNNDKTRAVRTKVKDLVDHFRGNRYGWYETAVLCILAKLYVMDKVSFRCNGNVVADRDLYFHLTNGTQQALTLVDIEEAISNSQVNKLKNAYKDFFEGAACPGISAKDVHSAFIDKLNEEGAALLKITLEHHFAFTTPLKPIIEQIKKWAGFAYPSLYKKTEEIEDFIDDHIDELEDIKTFVTGKQFDIFKSIDRMERGNQANMSYVSAELRQTLNEIYNTATPWKRMTEGKTTIDAIHAEIANKLEEAHQEIKTFIASKLCTLTSMPSYASLSDSQKAQVETLFNVFDKKEQEERFIGNLMGMKSEVEQAFNKCFDSINLWVEQAQEDAEEEKKKEEAKKQEGDAKEGQQEQQGKSQQDVTKPKVAVRKDKAMHLAWDKQVLESREDVEAYVEALRQQLLGIIKQNKNIMLS